MPLNEKSPPSLAVTTTDAVGESVAFRPRSRTGDDVEAVRHFALKRSSPHSALRSPVIVLNWVAELERLLPED